MPHVEESPRTVDSKSHQAVGDLDFGAQVHIVLLLNATYIRLDCEIIQPKKPYCFIPVHQSFNRFSFSEWNMALNTSGLVVSGRFRLIV